MTTSTHYPPVLLSRPFFRSWDQDRDLGLRSRDQDRDFGLQVSKPRTRPWPSGLKTKTETWVFRSRDQDRDFGHQVSRPRPRPWTSGLETKTETLDLGLQTKTESLAIRSRDRDLGLQVSRPRPRPWPSGLETETENWTKWTRVSRPWSRDHNTGCINSNWWRSTRLKVLQITVIVLHA